MSSVVTSMDEQRNAGRQEEETRSQILKHGNRGILTSDEESKMETVTTHKATYVPPKSPGVRLRGIRGELLEKHLTKKIREEVQAELNPPSPKIDSCSTTKTDFCVKGFVPLTPKTTQVHDYKTYQAITFWSENRHQIQGVTAMREPKAPFRKSALFSTPISERLDEIELLPDN